MIYLNQLKIIPTFFPDGTSQVWKIDTSILNSRANCIKWDFENESEFLHVAQLVDLLAITNTRITLQLDYFPYARQDKEINNHSTFALRTFCRQLSKLPVSDIFTVDLHSNVAFEYLGNLTSTIPYGTIEDIIITTKSDFVIFPDKGAKTRYNKIELPSFSIQKERNQLNGQLKILGIEGDPRTLLGKNVLIVDDICDGGGTFILAAEELRQHGVKTINLYTSHGIYSKGLHPLREAGILRIFNFKGEE